MSENGRLPQFKRFDRAPAEQTIAVVRARRSGMERRAAGHRDGSAGCTAVPDPIRKFRLLNCGRSTFAVNRAPHLARRFPLRDLVADRHHSQVLAAWNQGMRCCGLLQYRAWRARSLEMNHREPGTITGRILLTQAERGCWRGEPANLLHGFGAESSGGATSETAIGNIRHPRARWYLYSRCGGFARQTHSCGCWER